MLGLGGGVGCPGPGVTPVDGQLAHGEHIQSVSAAYRLKALASYPAVDGEHRAPVWDLG